MSFRFKGDFEERVSTTSTGSEASVSESSTTAILPRFLDDVDLGLIGSSCPISSLDEGGAASLFDCFVGLADLRDLAADLGGVGVRMVVSASSTGEASLADGAIASLAALLGEGGLRIDRLTISAVRNVCELSGLAMPSAHGPLCFFGTCCLA